jgi:hypothetical protein
MVEEGFFLQLHSSKEVPSLCQGIRVKDYPPHQLGSTSFEQKLNLFLVDRFFHFVASPLNSLQSLSPLPKLPDLYKDIGKKQGLGDFMQSE